ncbi:MAG: phosphomannomutase, partial [Sphingomicrobium sp.]
MNTPASHRFNPSVLREYDIRGIVGDTLGEADAFALGRTFAALALEQGASRIAVGRDGRSHSPMLEQALVDGLTESGIHVVRIGMGPSPMLYFATCALDVDGGIQVTGSHNPPDHNGFKICVGKTTIHGEQIQELRRIIEAGRFRSGNGKDESFAIIPAYQEHL